MGLLKEEIHVFEDFAKRQVQLYDDACDVGVVLTPRERIELREMIRGLQKGLQTKIYLTGDRERRDDRRWTAEWMCFFPWEVDEGMQIGTMVTLYFINEKHRGQMRQTLNVEFRNFNAPVCTKEWGWKS